MEQLNQLSKEIENLQKTLQRKQEQFSRITNELSINQNGINNIHNNIPPTNLQNTAIQEPKMICSNNFNVSYSEEVPNQYQCDDMVGDVTESFHNTAVKGTQNSSTNEAKSEAVKTQIGDKLPKWAIERYSRQILLPTIGVHGQERICAARVLIVGAGGLGCPAGVYLAGAGIGEIGVVDYDTVDVTNIHRQFLHSEKDQFISKAESAANSLRSINSRIKVTAYNVQLDSQNAVQIASQYDIVLDCTDNVPTRYLLNDLCVLTKIPLISGSALKMEGQLTIYGYRSKDDNEKEYIGPCYRCIFPSPPPPEAVGSCSANGVAGPVPGTIGSLQALEAIKYIVGQPHSQLLVGRMLLFDGEDMTFRTVKLRPRSSDCAACSKKATISQLIDYELFCKSQAKEKKKETRSNTHQREREKVKRMTGQSYYGFRTANGNKWVQDVFKSERKIGPACKSEICTKGTLKKCSAFDCFKRKEIFDNFWKLDWKKKKDFVKAMVDSVPVKRRRVKIKGEVSRKGDSKLYHLMWGDEKLPVCRVMFLNTLGVKEAMVRYWLANDRPKSTKQPIKAINVDAYLDSLPKQPTKCQNCIENGTATQYINLENIKNIFQLYNMYVQDMKLKNCVVASRKTFSKVVNIKNIRIFKAKNDSDVCDVVKEHNLVLNFERNYYYDNQW